MAPAPPDDPAAASASAALRATVSGRVQGVGYRAATVDRARALELCGWVRNQDDGTVLVHAEGDAAAVAELRGWLHEGPPGAHVDAVGEARAKVEGHEQFAVRGVAAGRFVVTAHDAEPAFVVLALEVDGALVAWRLAKEPSMRPADKRFATMVGPGAPAGAGAAQTWDHGTYEQGGRVAWPEAIERGHAVFVLHGDRLRGGFALQRTRGSGPGAGWLLVKRRDAFAAS